MNTVSDKHPDYKPTEPDFRGCARPLNKAGFQRHSDIVLWGSAPAAAETRGEKNER